MDENLDGNSTKLDLSSYDIPDKLNYLDESSEDENLETIQNDQVHQMEEFDSFLIKRPKVAFESELIAENQTNIENTHQESNTPTESQFFNELNIEEEDDDQYNLYGQRDNTKYTPSTNHQNFESLSPIPQCRSNMKINIRMKEMKEMKDKTIVKTPTKRKSTRLSDIDYNYIKQMKEYELNKLKEEKEAKEMEECTFQPNINKNPFIYYPKPDPEEITDRLYRNEFSKKQKDIDRIRREKEYEQYNECTFQPQITEKSRSISAKQRRISNNNKVTVIPSDMEYTFKPRTNSLKSNMKRAEQYLKKDPFQRLSNNKTKSLKSCGKENKNKVIDLNDYMNILTKHQDKENIIEYNSNERKSEKKHKFEEFLARQQAFQHITERKKQKLHEIYEKKDTPIKPKILPSPYTSKINKSFEERLEKDQMNRINKQNKLQEECYNNLTYRPKLTNKSKQMRSKTPSQLCYEDGLRKEINIERLKNQIKVEEKDFSFKPKINRKSSDSYLQLSNPNVLKEKINCQEKRMESMRHETLMKRQIDELKDCTFKPKINSTPKYIEEISESMKLARTLENRYKPKEKPTWKN